MATAIDTRPVRDLPHLLDLMTTVATTLDEVGADSFRELHVYVTGLHRGRPLGELALERGDIRFTTGTAAAALPGYMRADHTANRRALLLAGLCYAMWHWGLETAEVAAYLGCGAHVLDAWIARSAGDDVPAIPTFVAQRLRRLVVVEDLRLVSGVSDAAVGGWLRAGREAFGGRSVLSLLMADGETGFRRIVLWQLNAAAAPSATVH